ncbi:MAG: hypothetical protein AAGA30_01765 [Planctomycetota bacterium]
MLSSNQRTENNSAQTNNNQSTLSTTIREGAVAANVFETQSEDGSTYHYFVLSRSWKNNSGQSGYSSGFYARNAEAVVNVVTKAAEKCKELDSNQQKSN